MFLRTLNTVFISGTGIFIVKSIFRREALFKRTTTIITLSLSVGVCIYILISLIYLLLVQ